MSAAATVSVESRPEAGPPLPATFRDFKAPAPAGNQAIDKVRYSHKAMVDMIVQNPWISQAELARNFGYTEGWVSQVIASTAFQSYLEERKSELIDPAIRATIEERFKGLVARSIEILMRKLEAPTAQISDELALKALEVASKAAGYGSRGAGVQVNNNFVVAVPAKSATSADWAAEHKAGGPAVVSSPASRPHQSEVVDAVLVEPGPAASPTGADLLKELSGAVQK